MSYVLAHWSSAWVMPAVWAVLAAAHLGARTARGRGGQRRRVAAWRTVVWRTAAFQAGLLTALLALVSPLAYWSLRFIWVRSVQDLLLAVVAPALIVTGVRGRPGPADAAARPGRLAWPAAATLAFNAVWIGWHLPGPYDLATTSPAARYAQVVSYLAAGLLFWRTLTDAGAPAGPGGVAPPMRRLALLVGTAAVDTILGMVLVFGSGVLYPAYRGSAHHLFSVVADQQVGGGVLWMGMLPPMIIVALALVLGWLAREESDDLSRELDRLTGRAPAARPPAGPPVWAASGRAHRRPTI